jgi:hypothetical protein
MKNIKPSVWILSILCAALAANLIWSCQKESNSNEAVTTVEAPKLIGVSFQENRLVFASQASFEAAVDKLVEFGQKGTDKVEAQFPGFESNFLAYKKLMRENGENLDPNNLPAFVTATKGDDGEIYLKSSVDFKILRHLANKNGVYQVENRVIRVNYDKWYEADAAFANELEHGQNLDSNPNVTAHEIWREKEQIHERASFMSCSQMYDCSPCSRKYHGEVNNVFGPYNEVRTDMDHYKRGAFGAWYHNDAPSMNFTGTVNTQCCTSICRNPDGSCPTTSIATAMSGTDESEIFDVLLICCYGSCGGSCSAISTSTVTYSINGDFGFTGTCTATE